VHSGERLRIKKARPRRYFESGKATPKFEKLANELLARRSKAYRALATWIRKRSKPE
jgi:hypothetical protein